MRAIAPTCLLAFSAALFFSGAAHASKDPSGLWYDHDGRGAVEIAPCDNGRGYCGHIVHIKDPKNAKKCGLQILGNVTPGFGGWIYSPSRGRKFDVAVTRLSDTRLRVVGNAGHIISKTFVWERAPDDVERCDQPDVSAAVKPAKVAKAAPAEEPVAADEPRPQKTKAAEPVREALPPARTVTGALMSTMRPVKQVVESKPVVVKKEAATPRAEVARAEVADATETVAMEPDVEEDAPPKKSSKRKCKYRIPYVGRTITVPCR